MSTEKTNDDTPQAINLRTSRAIWLAKQLQYEDEPLTRTVERHLEAALADRERKQAAAGGAA